MIGSRSSRCNMFFVSIVLLFITFFSQIYAAEDDEKCTCSPRAFLFKLDLDTGTCPQIYPASELFGEGIKDYTCRISPSPNSSSSEVESASAGTGGAVETIIEAPARGFRTPNKPVVTSIQFIEVDTKFNVLHSTLLMGLELSQGDSFRYTTIKTDKTVGGISVILRGKNGEGYKNENVFTLKYTNECGVPTFRSGEKIGWVHVENFIPASTTTCGHAPPTTFTTSSSSSKPTLKPASMSRTPDKILIEVLKIADEVKEGGGSLFSSTSIIPAGFVSSVEKALASYYDGLIFDAIYQTTDASKLLGCDKKAEGKSSGASMKVSMMCDLLSEAISLAMTIGKEVGSSPTPSPSNGATTTVGLDHTGPPTSVGRPA
jgi:hypothetical protein